MRNLWEIGYGATRPDLLLDFKNYQNFTPVILLANLPPNHCFLSVSYLQRTIYVHARRQRVEPVFSQTQNPTSG